MNYYQDKGQNNWNAQLDNDDLLGTTTKSSVQADIVCLNQIHNLNLPKSSLANIKHKTVAQFYTKSASDIRINRKSVTKSRIENYKKSLLSSNPSGMQLRTERQLSKLEERNNQKVDMVKSLLSNLNTQEDITQKIKQEEKALQECEKN